MPNYDTSSRTYYDGPSLSAGPTVYSTIYKDEECGSGLRATTTQYMGYIKAEGGGRGGGGGST